MSFKAKILLTVLAIVSFDGVASFISRITQFEYTRLMWVSFLIYVLVGYWVAYRRGFVYGMLLGAVAGLTDSTLGWFVSRMIGPFLQTSVSTLDPVLIASVVVIVTGSALVFGSLGAGVCKLLGRTRMADA